MCMGASAPKPPPPPKIPAPPPPPEVQEQLSPVAGITRRDQSQAPQGFQSLRSDLTIPLPKIGNSLNIPS